MSIILHYRCPQCGQMTDLNFAVSCQYVHKKTGRVCGWSIPKTLVDFNSGLLAKVEKHTTEPSGVFPGQISYNTDTGFYLQNRETSLQAGNLYLDVKDGHFCTYITPSGASAIATVCSGGDSNRYVASGFKMPLNSKVQNLHGHYSNLDENMLFVATPEGCEVRANEGLDSSEFRVLKSGALIAAWDFRAQTGFNGSHIIIK